jgi:hypothetical protein
MLPSERSDGQHRPCREIAFGTEDAVRACNQKSAVRGPSEAENKSAAETPLVRASVEADERKTIAKRAVSVFDGVVIADAPWPSARVRRVV